MCDFFFFFFKSQESFYIHFFSPGWLGLGFMAYALSFYKWRHSFWPGKTFHTGGNTNIGAEMGPNGPLTWSLGARSKNTRKWSWKDERFKGSNCCCPLWSRFVNEQIFWISPFFPSTGWMNTPRPSELEFSIQELKYMAEVRVPTVWTRILKIVSF